MIVFISRLFIYVYPRPSPKEYPNLEVLLYIRGLTLPTGGPEGAGWKYELVRQGYLRPGLPRRYHSRRMIVNQVIM